VAIGKLWGRLGKWPRIIIIALFVGGLVLLGRLFFGTPKPEVVLYPEALWSIGGYIEEGRAVGGFPITNTMLGAWLTIIVLGILMFFATRKMKLVPHGIQNVMEVAVEGLGNFVDSVAGKENGRKFFPVLATIFFFVLFNAWLSLVPGFMSIGFWELNKHGEEVLVPLLRGANTDVNVPLALALVSFVFVEFWGLRIVGPRYLKKFFNSSRMTASMKQIARGKVKGAVGGLLYGFIDIFVSFIELMSEFIRIVSFTFRLFGNMMAGEILVFSMIFLLPWLIPSVFYVLELFVGLIQAIIFFGLSLVFVSMAVTPHAEHEEGLKEH
jgi:F-type H+-transporting ATPase subunit a